MLRRLTDWARDTGTLGSWLDAEWAAKGPQAIWVEQSDPNGIRPKNLDALSPEEVGAWFERHARAKFEEGCSTVRLASATPLRIAGRRSSRPPVESARAIAWYASHLTPRGPPTVASTPNGGNDACEAGER